MRRKEALPRNDDRSSMNDSPDQLAPTQRFSSRAQDYSKYRPGYPPELISLLEREARLLPSSVMADVGAGTGILSELFLRNGNTVHAIEPNDAMRARAEQSLGNNSRFHSQNSTAEHIDLADGFVDAVVVAQAFHWFDGPKAAEEFRRITKPSGFIALIWNVRNPALSPFAAEYERIVHAYGSEFARSGKEVVSEQRLRELFGPGLQQHELANFQDLDWPALRGRLLSASYMPLAGQPGHEPMLADLRRAFDAHQRQTQVRLEYETRVFIVKQTSKVNPSSSST